MLGASAASGFVLLLICALVSGETWPATRSLQWAILAGLSGAVGLASLYRGLAIGSAATVAPTAAVLTAALPVIDGAFVDGLPRFSQLAGFGLAFAGICLVAAAASPGGARSRGLSLAVLAGLGFGGFLTFIARVQADQVFFPLAVTRGVSLLSALAVMAAGRVPPKGAATNPTAFLAGVLDAGGNVFFLFARQHTRLDVAAVLSSLYPVATVILARAILHEPVSARQWAGAAVCLAAVALITV